MTDMRTCHSRGADYAIFQSILKLEYNFPDDFDPEAKRLVELLLKLEPKERATIEDLQKDTFYAQLNIDNIYLQEPPQIVPFLPGTEETNWDLVSMPGLDERQISRLLGLRLGESSTTDNVSLRESLEVTRDSPIMEIYLVFVSEVIFYGLDSSN